MSEAQAKSVNIKLTGGVSYVTASKVFQQGEVYPVSDAEWERLRQKRNPTTDAPMFSLTGQRATARPEVLRKSGTPGQITIHHANVEPETESTAAPEGEVTSTEDGGTEEGGGEGSDGLDDGTIDTGLNPELGNGGEGDDSGEETADQGPASPTQGDASSAPRRVGGVALRRGGRAVVTASASDVVKV